MTVSLTEVERNYLKSQPLARLATVDGSGAPQNNPVGAFLDQETDEILIGGHAMGATRKFRNVAANGQVALVVDELVSTDPWTVRGLEIRGTAVALEDVDPPSPYLSREVIRITPTWVASWGIDPAAPEMRIRRS
jgi:pyridoxamine 5'-phosphate oxidase family protein